VTVLKTTLAEITYLDTLLIAHRRAMKGKRQSHQATGFDYDLMSHLLVLQSELQNGTYRPSPYRKKIITEPKVRLIEAPAYRDRIVHHALHNHLSPFYEHSFITDSYACRPGRGIHHAAGRVQHFLRAGGPNLYVCQLDVSKYYASVNHDRLLELLRTKINDQALLDLLRVIIDSTDSGNEHDHLFASDSYYFTKGRRGIPIGNLTSQLFANIYLDRVDAYAKQTLKIHHYVRYMDDILFFHTDKAQLHAWRRAMVEFLYQDLYLTINPRKVRIYPAKFGVSFVGYVIYPHFLRLRGSSVRRFKKHYHRQLKAVMTERLQPARMRESFSSWKAHAAHARTKQLVLKLEAEQSDYLFVRAVRRYYRRQLAKNQLAVQLSLFDEPSDTDLEKQG
jgi:retron-type reverse transcriptase